MRRIALIASFLLVAVLLVALAFGPGAVERSQNRVLQIEVWKHADFPVRSR